LGLDLGGKSTSVVIDKGSPAAATPNILLDFESSATLQQENGATGECDTLLDYTLPWFIPKSIIYTFAFL
jgi:hypothetical protein